MDQYTPMKLFISHSSRDVAYISYLIQFLRDIGMDENNMFCSSIKGYGIPLGENIFDYLKEQFYNYRLKVIFVLSSNYYKSVASLNEMGAAWVLQQDYDCILLPKFGLKEIKGAIDSRKVSIIMDASEREVKSRLIELYASLKRDFNLKTVSHSLLEESRDRFFNNVRAMSSIWDDLNHCRELKRPPKEWIIPLKKLELLDPEGFDVLFLLAISYLRSGEIGMAKTYLEKAENVASDEEMRGEIYEVKGRIFPSLPT